MNRTRFFLESASLKQKEFAKDLEWPASKVGYIVRLNQAPGLDDCRAIVRALNARGVECSRDDVFPPEAVHQKSVAA
jgi:putative transcriptional regulator